MGALIPKKLRPKTFFGFLYPKQIVTLSMSQSHQIEIRLPNLIALCKNSKETH
jgi:hypothetical protein